VVSLSKKEMKTHRHLAAPDGKNRVFAGSIYSEGSTGGFRVYSATFVLERAHLRLGTGCCFLSGVVVKCLGASAIRQPIRLPLHP
jgi:hypothetical protein